SHSARMSRGVQLSLFGSAVVAALIALAGCSHYLLAEREPWRHDAEVACFESGAVKESPARVRISAISGPGICGADLPFRVSALGDSAPLGYDEEPVRPLSAIPNAAMPQRWPLIQSNALPPPAGATPYGMAPSAAAAGGPAPPGPPMSLYPPGVPAPDEDDFEPAPLGPYDGAPAARTSAPTPTYPAPGYPSPNYSSPAYPRGAEPPPLGPPRSPMGIAAAGPVEVKPPATLACPIVSALDKWIATAVQPAALHWFRRPVVEIKQISAYSCRGMNGDPSAHISEHAFGNALDIAGFELADGHKISVQYGWRGTPEEQGFLHDVQLAACDQFTTVLAPGANVYHYNHIHVDLMRRAGGRRICEPAGIPGEVVAERARARYAARHYGDPGVTGSLKYKPSRRALGYSGEDDDRLPLAVPGED
ncbi:MAG TPA: extensin family protein, partial [Xanthobacteraceae bacterium]|nr:extensin family protein [Xanthobacteraceae bacterium]